MRSLFSVLRTSVGATLGTVVLAATAMADTPPSDTTPASDTPTTDTPVPQAKCPGAAPGEVSCAPEPTTTEVTPPPQPEPEPQTTYTTPTYVEPTIIHEDVYETYGIGLSLGGGVSGFTESAMRDTTNDGGSWGVRAAFGMNSIIGAEAEYTGSAQSIDALGLDDDALLYSNGIQGNLRLNILPAMSVQPYVFGGIAYRHYDLSNDGANLSDIDEDDDVLEIPMGVGLGMTYEGFLFDARGEFRYADYEDMVPETSSDQANMHRWGVNANVGYAF